MRKPFALELPDIGEEPITAPEVLIPTADLHTIRLRVKRPFSDSINYGRIFTTINGESAGTIQEIKTGRDGHVINCDLDSKPLFRLRPGKNVIEIKAIDRSNRSYYASYVLLAGGGATDDPNLAMGVTIESFRVTTGEDREPPTIYLSEPRGVVGMARTAGSLKVHGEAVDNSGVIASVTVNGVSTAISSTTTTRDRALEHRSGAGVVFRHILTVGTDASSVIIEAKDRAANLTRLTIPVRRPEAVISSQFKGRKFAAVIGVSRYRYHDGGLKDLAYADADARSIRDFLQRPEAGNFAPSDILYLENEEATLDEVRAAFQRFLPKAAPHDLIFFYFAGHGAPDPYAPENLYLLMNDTKVADMPKTALPMTELEQVLDRSVRAQRIVVFIDACHSAGLSSEQLVTRQGGENNLINLHAQRLFKEKGRAVLTSSDVNEVSRESARWGGGHGIFTLALLEGMRGDADTNTDKLITAGELFGYVRDRVRVETAFRQNPRAMAGLNRDLTLTAVPAR